MVGLTPSSTRVRSAALAEAGGGEGSGDVRGRRERRIEREDERHDGGARENKVCVRVLECI